MERLDRQLLNQLMRRLASGDRSAFHPVYESTWPIVSRFAASWMGNDQSEDVAQQALLKVFSRASEFDVNKDALNWILGITSWECRSFRKKRSRRQESSIKTDSATTATSLEDLVIQKDLERALTELLGRLRPSDVETIMIAMNEDQRPDVKAATFRKRLQRALDRLRQAWRLTHDTDQ